jgi:hypothetical protein
MFRGLIAVGALAALAACAGVEPAGRNAGRAPAPPPQAAAQAEPAEPAPTPTPSVVAPDVSAPAPTPPPERRAGDDEIVVPGAVETQVLPPGDPRSNAERMEDIRAWDQCVTHVQAAYERDPMRPQLTSPEEYCRESLGMASRLAVPESRLQRRR